MTDWMDERERQHVDKRDAERRTESLQLHRRKMLEAKGRPLIDALTAQVGRDVERYHQKASEEPNRRVLFEPNPSGGFVLRQMNFPAVTVRCTFGGDLGVIIADYSFTQSHESGTRAKIHHLKIGVDSADNLTIGSGNERFASMEEVSREVIEAVLYPT